ncbi:MAG: hypothetical protein GX456_01290 [Verrucomicrobia bacterium]|nr:hypothetical protein [Verrucomicrobiota bacterium]
MEPRKATNIDRAMAEICRVCPVCRQARKNQTGLANKLVKKVEARLCPFCRAYERVYGKKAYEA